ncbi:MAG: HAMP domain-containing sensor histidine kinase [Gammaproteobacteria bacterium]
MGSERLLSLLPNLLEGYQLAVENKLLPEEKIAPKSLKALEENIFASIPIEAKKSIAFLNCLSPYNKQLVNPEIPALSIVDVVQNALKRFSGLNQDKFITHLDLKYDFKIQVAQPFIDCLLDHLLQNSYTAIKKGNKGEVTILAEQDAGYNVLRFQDTATGMNQETLGHIFNKFFSVRENQIVPGLGYCRLAILQGGGDILCEAIEGEYTRFNIRFPNC